MRGVPAYAASKGESLSFTRQLAVEYAGEGSRALVIRPGTIDMALVHANARAEPDSEATTLARYGQASPAVPIGTAEEDAAGDLSLASPQALFVTGEYGCVADGLMALST